MSFFSILANTENDQFKTPYMCMYVWVPLLFPWNYYNIVNLLYPTTKKS